MDFVCVGFDVRKWPWNGPLSADDSSWERNAGRYSELVAALGLWQNEYQVLEINSVQIAKAVSLVSSWDDCNLLSVEYPIDVVRLRDARLGFHTADTGIDLARFVSRGLDVCDFNGLFSILENEEIRLRRGTKNLLDSDELFAALELVQYANVLELDHAPYAVARLRTLK